MSVTRMRAVSIRGGVLMVVKQFSDDGVEQANRRYSPGVFTGVEKRAVFGAPDLDTSHTCHVERQNLTMRMQMRRMTRLTNAFSKKARNLTAAVHLHFAFVNFVRVHMTLRVTPAMAAGLTDHVWSMEELLDEVERAESNDPAPPTVPVAKAQAGGTVRALPGRPALRVIEGGAR
jgi:hypothetical protein